MSRHSDFLCEVLAKSGPTYEPCRVHVTYALAPYTISLIMSPGSCCSGHFHNNVLHVLSAFCWPHEGQPAGELLPTSLALNAQAKPADSTKDEKTRWGCASRNGTTSEQPPLQRPRLGLYLSSPMMLPESMSIPMLCLSIALIESAWSAFMCCAIGAANCATGSELAAANSSADICRQMIGSKTYQHGVHSQS